MAGSIHLFQIYGQLTSNQITLERNFLWDVIKIEWEEVFFYFDWSNSTVAHIS